MTATPDTLDWDCFTFGIIQKPDHFTFYASVDHLHIDGMSAGIIFLDIHLAYQDLIAGRPVTQPEIGGYRDYTARQCEQVANMDLSSPEIRDWIAFAQDTDGDWPSFPLELGDTWSNNKGDFITVELLNDDETEAFDAACRDVGARFSGGVMACAALAEHQLTGNTTYHGFTPSDTRTPGAETLSVGWFAEPVPRHRADRRRLLRQMRPARRRSRSTPTGAWRMFLWNGCWKWRRWTNWGSNCRASLR